MAIWVRSCQGSRVILVGVIVVEGAHCLKAMPARGRADDVMSGRNVINSIFPEVIGLRLPENQVGNFVPRKRRKHSSAVSCVVFTVRFRHVTVMCDEQSYVPGGTLWLRLSECSLRCSWDGE